MKNLSLFCAALLLCAAHSGYAQKDLTPEINNFIARTGAQITMQKSTGTPGFIRISADAAMSLEGAAAPDKSFAFLNRNPGIFGIRQDKDQFDVRASVRDQFGMEHVVLQQYYEGVPVFDGILKFHYDDRSNLRAVNGNFVTDITIISTPSVPEEVAGRNAVAVVSRQKELLSGFPEIVGSKLYIFQKGLAQGYRGAQYLVYEIEVSNRTDIREFVYIDAHSGSVIEQFTGMAGAVNRRLYNQTYSPSNPNTNLLWKEGDAFPGGLNIWQQSSIVSAGHIYNLFKTAFGYESYDGANATMISTHNNPGIQCPNANWNGVSANYCDQTAADDIVAHEWAHAYTQYTSGLIYAWQAGALNESFSDIWGETIDLLNGYMDEGETSGTPRDNVCNNSTRWLVGEKATAFGGAIRDMWNPNCMNHPGRVGDPLYRCLDSDNGGVHFNSGVPNHAYALLVDGGTYNGYTISGIGLTKAAHILWHTQSHYLSKTSNFSTFADALQAAGNDLLGIALPALVVTSDVPAASGETITAQDLAELLKVIEAVELYLETNCGFPPMFEAIAPLCEGAQQELAIFYEDFEGGFAGNSWVVSEHPVNGAFWIPRNWEVKENVYGRAGKVAFGADPGYGDCSLAASLAGRIRLESPDIAIPSGVNGPVMLAFDHLVALDESWSGGNLKYSVDNGNNWSLIPETAFIANSYNRPVHTGYNNPLQGERAFSGGNDGDLKSDWGTSIVDLSLLGLTSSGNIRLRWEVGTIGCRGVEGWYIDDVRIYSCAVTPAVHFAESSSFVVESEATTAGEECTDFIEKTITVQIDRAPSQPVTVTLVTDPSSTAQAGETLDFIVSGPASVTLDENDLSRDFTVRIYNDAYIEGTETVRFTYLLDANGGNAYAGTERQVHELTIVDDDLPPGNTTDNLLYSDFNSGRDGWVVKNGGTNYDSWSHIQYSDASLDPSGRPLFTANSYSAGTALLNEVLESPPFNSLGHKNLKLSFIHYFLIYNGGYNEQGYVEVWDGSAWQLLKHYCQSGCAQPGTRGSWSSPEQVTVDIPEEYVNAQMKIRFRYEARFDNFWAVDNIRIFSSHSTDIQTAVNTNQGDTQRLGPFETAAFYDPSNGNLMAKIKNLTGHDYGCTTVEVDRAGIDATSWFGSYNITNKTFKVTPDADKSDGQYEITLYYKASELPNFIGSQIKSIGKSSGGIGTGNTGVNSWAEVHAESAFESDYAFTATFNSGFSGFGLSDAPPVGSLPVKLVEITGTGTREGNFISWSTASESNSDFFSIERSGNAVHFTEIAKVTSAGNSISLQTYSFLDTGFPAGLSYYRLKAVDLDGSYIYSQIVAVNGREPGGIKFGPNPVQDNLRLTIPGDDVQTVTLDVFSLTGQRMLSFRNVRSRNSMIEQDLSTLQSGVYKVVVQKGGIQHILTIVKL